MIYINQLTVIASFATTVRETIATAIAIVKHLMSQESSSPWFIEEVDTNDYEDPWTEKRPLFVASIAFPKTEKVEFRVVRYPFIKITTIVEPPKVQQMPILATSKEEAWDTLEKHLWDNEDYETTILSIEKVSVW